jgi:AraC-like DNA-binding protein
MTSPKRRIHWSEATPVVRQAATSTAPPSYVIPRAWFTEHIVDFDLWLVCEGRAELVDANGTKTVLTRGSTVWLAPGAGFELRVDTSGPYTNIHVHFDLVDRSGRVIPHRRVETPPATGFIYDIHYFESTLRRIMFLQYQCEQSDLEARAALQTQMSLLLKGLLYDYQLALKAADSTPMAGIQKHHSGMISSALSWLYLHPESALSAADLANKYGYSQRHFCRIFRHATGKTPGQVLIEAKIDHAKKLLATSALNITEIAESLRYENVFYFSRQFKQVTGMAPVEFRKRPPTQEH